MPSYKTSFSRRQMIKRISLVRFRRDVPRDRCLESWTGEHADIVRRLPGVLEYTVDVATGRRPPAAWDAVATLRFASKTALEHFQADPTVQDELLSTRDRFAEAVDVFLVEEHQLIPKREVT
jgi:hypothetical protein